MLTGDKTWAIGKAVELALADSSKKIGVFKSQTNGGQRKTMWKPHLIGERAVRGFDLVMSVKGSENGLAFIYPEK